MDHSESESCAPYLQLIRRHIVPRIVINICSKRLLGMDQVERTRKPLCMMSKPWSRKLGCVSLHYQNDFVWTAVIQCNWGAEKDDTRYNISEMLCGSITSDRQYSLHGNFRESHWLNFWELWGIINWKTKRTWSMYIGGQNITLPTRYYFGEKLCWQSRQQHHRKLNIDVWKKWSDRNTMTCCENSYNTLDQFGD